MRDKALLENPGFVIRKHVEEIVKNLLRSRTGTLQSNTMKNAAPYFRVHIKG